MRSRSLNGSCAVGASTDQRQVARAQQGDGCDIGAFEVMKPTPGVSVTLFSRYPTRVAAWVSTGRLVGGAPVGFLSWTGGSVGLTNVTILGLNAIGLNATILGTAVLTDGSPVGFTLEVRADYPQRIVRLRLSNGYDSGEQRALIARVTPLPTFPNQ